MMHKNFTFEQKNRFMAENDVLIRSLVDETGVCQPEEYKRRYQAACVGATKALNTYSGTAGEDTLILHVMNCVRAGLAVLA